MGEIPVIRGEPGARAVGAVISCICQT
jgi:hypothetical protein